MFHILTPNPEVYREWQYNQYQQSLEDNYCEPVICDICGERIKEGDEVFLHSKPHESIYACECCVRCEMDENEYDRDDALKALVDLSKKYSK